MQASLAEEIDAIASRHPGDGLLQLQMLANRLATLFEGVAYDHSRALAAAASPAAAACEPWQSAGQPFPDTLFRCGPP